MKIFFIALFALGISFTIRARSSANQLSALYAKSGNYVLKCAAETYTGVAATGACNSEIFFLWERFCFNGPKQKLIEAISAGMFNFGNEEWVGTPNHYGENLSFIVFDGPNGDQRFIVATPCDKDFFK